MLHVTDTFYTILYKNFHCFFFLMFLLLSLKITDTEVVELYHGVISMIYFKTCFFHKQEAKYVLVTREARENMWLFNCS